MRDTDDHLPDNLLEGVGISAATLALAERAPEYASSRSVALAAAAKSGTGCELARILRDIRRPETDVFDLYRRYRKYAETHFDGMDLWEIGKAQEVIELIATGEDPRDCFLHMLTPPEDRLDWPLDDTPHVSATLH